MAKVRSPNYPRLSLPEAIERIKVVFAKEHRHAVDKQVVAQALGYSSMHGKAMAIISAMLKYGLLEPVGEQLRVTSLGQDLAVHEPSDPEWMGAVQVAAFNPSLWGELHAMYGDELPSDNAIRAHLVKNGFNQNTVADVIRGYRDTVEYVAEVSPLDIADPLPPEMGGALEAATEANAPRGLSRARQSLNYSNADSPSVESTELWFKLSRNSEVRLAFDGQVTQASIQKLIRLLEVSLDTFPESADIPHSDIQMSDDG